MITQTNSIQETNKTKVFKYKTNILIRNKINILITNKKKVLIKDKIKVFIKTKQNPQENL